MKSEQNGACFFFSSLSLSLTRPDHRANNWSGTTSYSRGLIDRCATTEALNCARSLHRLLGYQSETISECGIPCNNNNPRAGSGNVMLVVWSILAGSRSRTLRGCNKLVDIGSRQRWYRSPGWILGMAALFQGFGANAKLDKSSS